MLVLDSLEDPQNFGTLLRSGEAVGVHGVIYPTRRAAPLSPAAIKASAGATEHLLLAAVEDLPGTLADLHGRGLRIVAAEEDAALDYTDADLRGPIAIIVGSEGKGISAAVRRRIDLSVRIPMRGKIASLNAAVAGSVLLFAAAHQRPVAVKSIPSEPRPKQAPAAEPQPEEAEQAEKKATAKASKSKAAAKTAKPAAKSPSRPAASTAKCVEGEDRKVGGKAEPKCRRRRRKPHPRRPARKRRPSRRHRRTKGATADRRLRADPTRSPRSIGGDGCLHCVDDPGDLRFLGNEPRALGADRHAAPTVTLTVKA